MDKLKPCPFCGGEEIEKLPCIDGILLHCNYCEADVSFRDDLEESQAVTMWNNRAKTPLLGGEA